MILGQVFFQFLRSSSNIFNRTKTRYIIRTRPSSLLVKIRFGEVNFAERTLCYIWKNLQNSSLGEENRSTIIYEWFGYWLFWWNDPYKVDHVWGILKEVGGKYDDSFLEVWYQFDWFSTCTKSFLS